MKINEKGITLLELIAALALVSIIATAAWTALNIGMQHGAAETTKTQLQQDANIIVSKITNEHRRNDYYFLQLKDGQIEINTCNDLSKLPVEPTPADLMSIDPATVDCDGFINVTDNNYLYTASINGTDLSSWDETKIINPKKTHINFILEIADPAKHGRSVKVKTTFTRILTNSN